MILGFSGLVAVRGGLSDYFMIVGWYLTEYKLTVCGTYNTLAAMVCLVLF